MTERAFSDIRDALVRTTNVLPWTTEYDLIGDHFDGIVDSYPAKLHGPRNLNVTHRSPDSFTISDLSQLSDDDFEFIAASRSFVARLLAFVDALEELCTVSEMHAAQFDDVPSVYVDDIRSLIRHASGDPTVVNDLPESS